MILQYRPGFEPRGGQCQEAVQCAQYASAMEEERLFPTFITVAPSFVIVCLPLASTINRSPPYGPRVDLMVACTAVHAFIFEIIWPFPWEVSVPNSWGEWELGQVMVGSRTFFQDDDGGSLPAERHFGQSSLKRYLVQARIRESR